jgi:hypothetical protein
MTFGYGGLTLISRHDWAVSLGTREDVAGHLDFDSSTFVANTFMAR